MTDQVGDTVFVPSSMLENGDGYSFALHRSTVTETSARSVKVNQADGSASEFIATSKCHKNIGICIINVGDNGTEISLLDPLAKSLLQFCRLLMSDDYVRLLKVRSLAELEVVWRPISAAYSHVLLVGHGNGTHFKFAVDGWVAPSRLSEALHVNQASEKLFISLTCQAGFKAFGGEFSKETVCRHFIGPFHSIHGAVGSQFAQTFLSYQLLAGETVKVAFRHARERVPMSSSFRLWQNGKLTAGPK